MLSGCVATVSTVLVSQKGSRAQLFVFADGFCIFLVLDSRARVPKGLYVWRAFLTSVVRSSQNMESDPLWDISPCTAGRAVHRGGVKKTYDRVKSETGVLEKLEGIAGQMVKSNRM